MDVSDLVLFAGRQAFLGFLLHAAFIALSFYALQSLRVEQFVRKQAVFQVRLLFLLTSIAIGSACASFFLSMLDWSAAFARWFQ